MKLSFFLLLVSVSLFQVAGLLPSLSRFARTRTSCPGSSLPLRSARRDLFFDIVKSGLADRFPRAEEISRVYDFIAYASGEKALPQEALPPQQDVIPEYLPGLTAQPWWNASTFQWAVDLEKHAPEITQELQTFLREGAKTLQCDSHYATTMGPGWSAIRLQRMGHWLPEQAAHFPRTLEILKACHVPVSVRGVVFARQAPKSGVAQHSDGRNFILTGHLGLMVPPRVEECVMVVAGEARPWQENKLLLLDTSFLHHTENNSDHDRYVLIIDVWHPEVTEQEKTALRFLYDARLLFESGKPEEIDCSYVKSGQPLTAEEYEQKKSRGKSLWSRLWG